jgi:hypothetical protein
LAIINHASGEAWVDASPRMDRGAVADLLREVTTERSALPRPRSRSRSPPAWRWVTTTPVIPQRSLPSRDRHVRIARSPSYHYEPETNGCAEKFIQTLKEEVRGEVLLERYHTLGDRELVADHSVARGARSPHPTGEPLTTPQHDQVGSNSAPSERPCAGNPKHSTTPGH